MRVPVFEKLARTFKLGKWKHFRGYDLDGNRYFEIPGGPHGLPKRTVDYRVKREWSDYQFYQMPVQWSAWMRRTRKEPPGIEELQRDHDRQARLKINVAELERQYREEKAAQLAEAEKVAQLDAPMRKPAQEAAKYPSQDNPAMVPTSMAGTHPPSQEAGASVPRERPEDASFPSVAQGTPERQQMAAALNEVADMNLGKVEKERQLAGGAPQAPEQPGQAAKPADDFKPEEWKPVSRRR